jgi:drug/metabolite transporter (DMT)-like permease
MNKDSKWYPLVLLNMGMLFSSSSGAFGRYIDLSPPHTIGYRAFMALLLLLGYALIQKHQLRFDLKTHGLTVFLSGVLMALHWVFYFYALRWGSVAIGMLSLFTYPVFTSLLEPLFFKSHWQWRHLLMSLLIIIGIYFLAPSLDPREVSTQGLLMGLFSAFTYSLRNILLKKKVDTFKGSTLMLYQMAITTVLLFPAFFIYSQEAVKPQLPYIGFLALLTTVGHTLFINSFRYFSISTVSILSSIQPLLGILLGIIFLAEIPSERSIIGGVLILFTVVLESRKGTS